MPGVPMPAASCKPVGLLATLTKSPTLNVADEVFTSNALGQLPSAARLAGPICSDFSWLFPVTDALPNDACEADGEQKTHNKLELHLALNPSLLFSRIYRGDGALKIHLKKEARN